MPLLLSVLALMIWGLGGLAGAAQGQNLPETNQSSFHPLDMPDPNVYRGGDGRPGPEYWQQRADYAIDVELKPTENRIVGSQTITYTNNSPEDLNRLWVQLDQNLFDPDSRGAAAVPDGARFSGFFEGGGYDIGGVTLQREDGSTASPDVTINDTRMLIPLAEPLAAEGGTVSITLDFAFTMPEYGADRMGYLDVAEGTVYQLAQWYPRMYVYDDVHGWNPLPYLGQGEYYLEYGQFTVDITVPRDFVVTATGTLQNPGEVLTRTQRDRLAEARQSESTVTIIGEDEVGTDGVRPDGEGPLTWRFKADRVRDFAWSASQAFVWDAAGADAGDETVLAQSFYPQEGIGSEQTPGWERSTEYVQHSVEYYSDLVAPYPYPMATNVAGVVAGMEYPQIMFCSVDARGRSLFGVTDHEFGHTWFPMVVGSDERRWAWMDEGLNSYMGVYSEDAFYGESNQKSLNALASRTRGMMRTTVGQQPIMTHSDHLRRQGLGFLAYRKPAYGLALLREYVVGPERFDAAFRAYFDRWAYKHPKPADFFRTMEEVTGENLDWFWRSWFYETDVVDQAVTSVSADPDSDLTIVTVRQNQELMLPITVQLTFADGSTERRRVPAEAFFTNDAFELGTTEGEVTKVVLDPDGILPDAKPGNDTWETGDE